MKGKKCLQESKFNILEFNKLNTHLNEDKNLFGIVNIELNYSTNKQHVLSYKTDNLPLQDRIQCHKLDSFANHKLNNYLCKDHKFHYPQHGNTPRNTPNNVRNYKWSILHS